MSKSSTVTVRETPVAPVVSASVGSLTIHGETFLIETDPPRIGQADGELIGTGPFKVTVEPLAARVLVPKR